LQPAEEREPAEPPADLHGQVVDVFPPDVVAERAQAGARHPLPQVGQVGEPVAALHAAVDMDFDTLALLLGQLPVQVAGKQRIDMGCAAARGSREAKLLIICLPHVKPILCRSQ